MVTGVAYAQTIPVSNFENWTITNYDDLNTPWFTSNENTVPDYGVATAKKVTGHTSTNAVRLETYVSGTDTSTGYITNTEGDPTIGEGGVPYSQKPTGVTGFFRYNLPANDTALLIIVFKKNGTVISSNTFKIKGTGTQSTFASFSYPLSMAVTPDSVVIAATSSNIDNTAGMNGASWIEFDQLSFTGPGVTQIITNGDFEGWTAKSNQVPNDWSVYGDITRSTDKYQGTYAAKLVSVDDGTGDADLADMNVFKPYTRNTADTLTGYYKYTAAAPGDSATIIVLFFNNGMPDMNSFTIGLKQVSTYTKFSLPIKAPGSVSDVYINVLSGTIMGTPAIGSVLYIDDLNIKQGPVSVNNTTHKKADITVYPNPAKDIITIRADNHEDLTAKLFDNTGKLLAQQVFSKDKQSMNFSLHNIPAGMYHFVLYTTEGSIYTVKTVSKQ